MSAFLCSHVFCLPLVAVGILLSVEQVSANKHQAVTDVSVFLDIPEMQKRETSLQCFVFDLLSLSSTTLYMCTKPLHDYFHIGKETQLHIVWK